jgi:hypothetical protein
MIGHSSFLSPLVEGLCNRIVQPVAMVRKKDSTDNDASGDWKCYGPEETLAMIRAAYILHVHSKEARYERANSSLVKMFVKTQGVENH